MNYEKMLKAVMIRIEFIKETSLSCDTLNNEYNALVLIRAEIYKIIKGVKKLDTKDVI